MLTFFSIDEMGMRLARSGYMLNVTYMIRYRGSVVFDFECVCVIMT
jgi:hypothetical protein